ncbi:MAG: magnesium/cobalt transporter CorA [Planctomycetota bacterium]
MTLRDFPAGEMTGYVSLSDHTTVRACQADEALAAVSDPQARVWVNFVAPEREHLTRLVANLGFHELAVEDVFSPSSRAKVEEYPGHLFCVMPALNQNPGAENLDIINLTAFLGRNFLITTHRAPLPAIDQMKERMERGEAPLRGGPDFVLYQLLDAIVDEYLTASDELNATIDALESRLLQRRDRDIVTHIFALKRRTAWLRRRIRPQRDIVNILTSRPHELIRPETQVYLRDVYDHVFRVSDNLDTFYDLLQGAMSTYLAQVSNRTNESMRVLSAVATVFLPLNVLTGLYGTNFSTLPGGSHPMAFWLFCGILVTAGVTTTWLLRRRRLL